jgi:hypothetical protein
VPNATAAQPALTWELVIDLLDVLESMATARVPATRTSTVPSTW